MIALSELEVKRETIELMDGERVADWDEVEQRYREWAAHMGSDPDGLFWIRYFATYNNYQTHADEAMP